MMNLLALSLVLSTLLAAEVWSPSPAMTTQQTKASEGDVIVKDGHRVVVVEYDRDGKTNTRVSISPPSANQGEGIENEEEKGSSFLRNAKEKVKETASYLPHVGQGISQPVMTNKEETEDAHDHHATAGEVICDAFGKCRQKIASVVGRAKDRTADTVGETASDVGDAAARKAHGVKETAARVAREVEETMMTNKEETEEARDHHATAGEVICDAFGKCRQKIASVVGRAKDRTADTVGDTASDVGDAAARKAHGVKETAARAARDVEETMAGKAQYAKEKVTDKAHDVRESVAHKAQDAKDKVSDKAHDVKETVAHKARESKERDKDRVREKAHELKGKAAHKSQDAWVRVKAAARGFGSATAATLSPTKVASVVGLTAIAAAFGTCVWVTFVSSYVLASVLGRQKFGVVQSKLYPVYFKATSVGILVGLFGHVLSRRRKIVTDATEMWQGVNLLSSFFMIEANKSFVEPRATKAMFERMKAEKEEGRGGEKSTNEQELRRKLEKLSERLSKLNTYSSWLNILTLMSLTWHFVYLGHRLGAAC